MFDLFDTLVDQNHDRLAPIEIEGRRVGATAPALHARAVEGFDVALEILEFADRLRALDQELRIDTIDQGLELSTLDRFTALGTRLGQSDVLAFGNALTAVHMGVLQAAVTVPQHHEGILTALAVNQRIGICSNFTHAETARSILREAGFEQHLSTVVISEEIGIRKPRSEIFEAVAESLGMAPGEILHVGRQPASRCRGRRGGWHAHRLAHTPGFGSGRGAGGLRWPASGLCPRGSHGSASSGRATVCVMRSVLVDRTGLDQLEDSNLGCELGAVPALHVEGPRHRAERRGQRTSRCVLEGLTRFEGRLFSYDAGTMDFFGMAGAVDDRPMPVQQLDSLLALVRDPDRVEKEPAARGRVAVLGRIARANMNANACGLEQARLRSWLLQEEERRGSLELVRSRHQALAREANAVRRRLESRSTALLEREARLGRMIELVAQEDSSTLESAPIQDFKGVLDWPLEGRVVTDFGPRLDPRYRTQVPHNGIAIAAADEAPVIPVYPGKVLFAAPFQGYGLTVVIQHAGDVLTLYAGVDSLGVARGDMVSLGDVLGAAADEIYFELREKNRAVDPLDWLR